jgi:PEP-CTERM motif
MKGINVLGLGATFAAVAGAITLSSSSAQAFTLVPTDRLFGSADFEIVGDAKTSLQFDFADVNEEVGTPGGVFRVSKFNSTNVFDAYKKLAIQDVTFANGVNLTNFLSYDDGVGGKEDFSLNWNDIKITYDVYDPTTDERKILIKGTALFVGKNGGNYSGVGDAVGQLTVDYKTGQANFDYKVKAVPEPASVLGLLAVGALGAGSLKRKQKKQLIEPSSLN